MTTECNDAHVHLGHLGRREIILDFEGGRVTSDGGLPLFRLAEQKFKILERFAGQAMEDYRSQRLIEHPLVDLLGQRVFGLAFGYEDLNDHDALMGDPLWAAALGKEDVTGSSRRREVDLGKPLAGKSTLNRLELTPENPANERYRRINLDPEKADEVLATIATEILQRLDPDREELIIDLDPSDIRLHGNQEGRFYHGYYGDYVYLPVYAFCEGVPLGWRLQSADQDGSRPTTEMLERIVPCLRAAFPNARLVLRADSGFSREAIYAWCEANDVDYVIGLAKNSRLIGMIANELAEAKTLSEASGEPERVFKEFSYKTLDSWSRERRVIAKAEQLLGKANPRFVVTSLTLPAREIYEDVYCPRGDAENWIKEQQLDLFGTRASSSEMRANQNRGYFTVLAHLFHVVVRAFGLRGTDHERSTAGTIRLHLLKLGARIRMSARRLWIHVSSHTPFQSLFRQAYANLQALPEIVM